MHFFHFHGGLLTAPDTLVSVCGFGMCRFALVQHFLPGIRRCLEPPAGEVLRSERAVSSSAGSGWCGHSDRVKAVNKQFLQFQSESLCDSRDARSHPSPALSVAVFQAEGWQLEGRQQDFGVWKAFTWVCVPRKDCFVADLTLSFQSCSAVCLCCCLSDVCACESSFVLAQCPKCSFSCRHSKAKKLVLFMAEQLEGYRK